MSVVSIFVCLLNVPNFTVDININTVFLMTVSLLSVLVTVVFNWLCFERPTLWISKNVED